MGVHFLIDSASDILPSEAAAMGITCIPMQITFGQETYADSVTLSHGEFYEKLATSETLPVTSQINPATYEDYFSRLTAGGEELVVITLSSQLSGTCQSARIAAENFPGKVFVVDSLNAAIGERILLLRGLELAKSGMSAAQIAQTLAEEAKKIRLFAIIDTLEYLKKGGRISATVAFAGELLGIKPAIAVRDGLVAMAGKARGAKQGQALLRQLIEKTGGIDWTKPVASVYSASDATLLQFLESCADLWDGHERPTPYSLGCTIGTHIGSGACGIAFFEK
jgi:DegV family protein with EDD domain